MCILFLVCKGMNFVLQINFMHITEMFHSLFLGNYRKHTVL